MASARQDITALIYDKRGRLISVGRNSYTKTHPLQARCAAHVGLEHKIYLHAEVDALVKFKDWSKAHKIVITRYDKAGNPVNAKPCPVCQRAIAQAGIKEVEHT